MKAAGTRAQNSQRNAVPTQQFLLRNQGEEEEAEKKRLKAARQRSVDDRKSVWETVLSVGTTGTFTAWTNI